MAHTFDLEQYLNDGVEHFVKSAVKATLKNPKESAFLLKYGLAAKRAAERRRQWRAQGVQTPSFLIASITGDCNLRCAGCYAHANAGQGEAGELSAGEWGKIFDEAVEIGVSMILLAGGEPLVRRDVLAEAAKRPELVFPVFTNGTLVDEEYAALFDRHRHLVPLVSIEGSEILTDARRGAGVYAKTTAAMEKMRKLGLLFGASITVTKENLAAVTDKPFLAGLQQAGSKVVLYVEYVPVDRRELALDDAEQAVLEERVNALRSKKTDRTIYVSFPGDEKEAEGCLAAGRGFFHINAAGGAEPCPFSPYSDTNVTETGLLEALRSPLFRRLRETGILAKEHTGGCVLFEQEKEVRQLVTDAGEA